jgi:hypothetical protein
LAPLSVLKFNDPSRADRVLLVLQGMQERQLITMRTPNDRSNKREQGLTIPHLDPSQLVVTIGVTTKQQHPDRPVLLAAPVASFSGYV